MDTKTISRASIECEILNDEEPDTSYADQPGYERDRSAIDSGEIRFYGVRARVAVPFTSATPDGCVISPGLWNIGMESDPSLRDAHIAAVFADERAWVQGELVRLGFELAD